jgi:hypothetical protein
MQMRIAEIPEDSGQTSLKERINPAFELEDAVRAQTEQIFLNSFELSLKSLLTFEAI